MVESAVRTKQVGEYYFSGKLSVIREMIADGDDIINMGIGSPDMTPPAQVIDALRSSMYDDGAHAYQPYRGIDELRTAMSDWYHRYYNFTPDPQSQVLPLIGSKEGILHISMAFLDSGDAVLVPDTGYPAYATAARICGARCVHYDLDENNNWMPDLKSIEQNGMQGIKLMWVNYPNMPSGMRPADSLFRELAGFALKHNILVVNDNPYSFILNNEPRTILSADKSLENVLELNSLSKSHNMAGWRLGMVVGHEDHINNILKIKSNMDSGMFLPVQKAAIEALRTGQEWYDNLNEIYALRQRMTYDLLDGLSCSTREDQTGMFLWSRIPDAFADSNEFSDYCLHRYGIFITPGLVFGENGSRYIRASLCINEARINEAIKRVNNK
ncbi:MAG: pyridoxal phosphate-dependent aminotransferase [Bacteroidota bacterium]